MDTSGNQNTYTNQAARPARNSYFIPAASVFSVLSLLAMLLIVSDKTGYGAFFIGIPVYAAIILGAIITFIILDVRYKRKMQIRNKTPLANIFTVLCLLIPAYIYTIIIPDQIRFDSFLIWLIPLEIIYIGIVASIIFSRRQKISLATLFVFAVMTLANILANLPDIGGAIVTSYICVIYSPVSLMCVYYLLRYKYINRTKCVLGVIIIVTMASLLSVGAKAWNTKSFYDCLGSDMYYIDHGHYCHEKYK